MTETVDLEAEVLDTVASLLKLDRSRLTLESTTEQLDLDSLDLVKLTFAVERRFAVSLSGYGFQDVDSMGKLVHLVAQRIADKKGRCKT